MRFSVISKKLITISLIVLALVLAFGSEASLIASGEGRYVLVTLKDSTVLKFEFDSFVFNWINPEIKDETTCQATLFASGEVEEIRVLNENINDCDHIDGDWLFQVVFKEKDRPSIQGFIAMRSKEVVGVLVGTSEERTIPIEEINAVSFQ